MSAHDRTLFYLRSQTIRRGSLYADLGLVLTTAQIVLPVVSDLGPTGIWQYAKEAFEFLKIVFEAKKAGAPVTIEQTGDGLVNVNTGSQTLTFNGPVYYIANGSLAHYEFLSKQLAPDRVIDIRLSEGPGRDIGLQLHDRDLFELPTKIGDQQHSLKCEIFEFDKYDGTGRLAVQDGQSIPKGEYRFTVIGRQELSEYIEAMLHEQVTVTCLEEIVDHPLVGRKIAALQLINVKN
jgi:hypothetical protein